MSKTVQSIMQYEGAMGVTIIPEPTDNSSLISIEMIAGRPEGYSVRSASGLVVLCEGEIAPKIYQHDHMARHVFMLENRQPGLAICRMDGDQPIVVEVIAAVQVRGVLPLTADARACASELFDVARRVH